MKFGIRTANGQHMLTLLLSSSIFCTAPAVILPCSFPAHALLLPSSCPTPAQLLPSFCSALLRSTPTLLIPCSFPASTLLLPFSWPAPGLILVCSCPAPSQLLPFIIIRTLQLFLARREPPFMVQWTPALTAPLITIFSNNVFFCPYGHGAFLGSRPEGGDVL